MEKKYYLYLHKYAETNKVFYVGIGSSKNFNRAFVKTNRNKYWYEITNNYKYSIEIVLTDLTKEEACQKEIEYIKLYGRIDLGTGTLVNLTPGGEGVQEWTAMLREKLRKSRIGKKLSKETLEKLTGGNSFFSKKVLNLETGEVFSCIREAAEKVGVNAPTLGRWLNGKRHNPTQLVFLEENIRKQNKPKKEKKIKIKKGKEKSVLQYDLQGNFLQEFTSIKKASEFLGKSYASSIGKCAKGICLHAYGYFWKFKTN